MEPPAAPAPKPLEGRVAVVAGATRGAGRGIARALGEAGATVYATGRSTAGAPSDRARPETIEETAAVVTAAGGEGVAVRVDHADGGAVAALFARVEAERGRLDVVVSALSGGEVAWGKAWALDVAKGWAVFEGEVLPHLLTARHALPVMRRQGHGLLVEVTDGDTFGYRGTLFYDLVKTTTIRLAYALAVDLRGSGVTALALTPGFLRSEAMLDHFGVTEANWRDGAKRDPHFVASETPLYVGRAVVALATDPDVGRRAGRAWSSWGLAAEYGFTDADGSRPDFDRHLADVGYPGFDRVRKMDDAFYSYWRGFSEGP